MSNNKFAQSDIQTYTKWKKKKKSLAPKRPNK